jgi:hypothetical protein
MTARLGAVEIPARDLTAGVSQEAVVAALITLAATALKTFLPADRIEALLRGLGGEAIQNVTGDAHGGGS